MQYLQDLFQALDLAAIQSFLLRAIAIFICLTVHETCHGLAAYALGDPTAKSMHRLSLNPLRHIDWFGLGMMFFAGFGWAKPVPVNPNYFKKPKQGMALTALAGPVSNLLLAVLVMLACKVILLFEWNSAFLPQLFEFLLFTLAPLSVGLGVFNLIPFPPLDGSKVLGGLLPERIYFRLMRYERYGMLILLLISITGIGGNFIGNMIFEVYNSLLSLIFEV